MAQASPYVPPAIVSEAVKRWDEAKGHHDKFVREYERRERAYRGILRANQQAAKWRHKYHPPYAFNLLETIVSNTVEMGLEFDVRPSPKIHLAQQEAIQLLDQTQAVADLLRHDHRVDEMDFKQRPLFLTAAIGGRGVGKVYWDYYEGATKRQGYQNVPIHGPDGQVLTSVPVITEIEESGVLRDHSTFEVVDPRDWTTHESARTLDPCKPGGAQYVFHRCWYSFDQLKQMEADGFFQNVDLLKNAEIDFSGEYADREKQIWDVSRTKDLIEVLEYWKYEKGKVWRAYIGNRAILLRDVEPNPFWHGGYPFVICSSMPQPFTTIGVSDIELVEQLQEMLWELASQRFDNMELLNNFITLIRSDVEDPDAFEWYPGARWPVDSVDQVQALQPPYQLANITLEAEALIKGDLQNVTSSAPFAGGAETGAVQQNTATGASIIMNAAQQRLAAKKFEAQKALMEQANMRIKLDQQFLTDDSQGVARLVHVLGSNGVNSFRPVSALDIQGEFLVELRAIGESQMRQERRAEAMQVLQMMQQLFPSSYVSGHPIDMQQVVLWVMRQWGLEDEAQSFFEPPQQPDPGMAQLLMGNAPHVQLRGTLDPSQTQQAGSEVGIQAPAPNMGVTSATAVDASQPSATGGLSMSPALMISRALAARGGVQK